MPDTMLGDLRDTVHWLRQAQSDIQALGSLWYHKAKLGISVLMTWMHDREYLYVHGEPKLFPETSVAAWFYHHLTKNRMVNTAVSFLYKIRNEYMRIILKIGL